MIGLCQLHHADDIAKDLVISFGAGIAAMSLVPAMMWTTAGLSAMASDRNRTSIWGAVWPEIPLSTK